MTEQQITALLKTHSTPLYVFDIPMLKERTGYLQSVLPEGIALCYAMKGNPFLVKELEGCVERFEVCSPGEYRICEAMALPPERLVISGVQKAPADVEEMVARHPEMIYTVESVRQFQLLREAARRHRCTLQVLLRLTSGNQFGLDEKDLRAIVRRREECPEIALRGIQYFSGTQKRTVKRLRKELDKLTLLLRSLEEADGFRVQELEFGAGFPVHYFQSEEFDEDAFLKEFAAVLAPLAREYRVTLELGRSIAASCGTYLTRVVDQKTNQGQNYAILDGGMNHLVYFGQTMAMKVPHYRLLPAREGETRSWNLCGSLCTTNDLLVKQLPVAALEIGDVFAFERAGAYCMTEGISLFLSRDLPEVVLRTDDGMFQTVRGHTPTHTLNTSAYKRRTDDYGNFD